MRFTTDQGGVDPGARPPVLSAAALGGPDGVPGLRAGQAAAWRIELDEVRASRVALTIIAGDSGTEWLIPQVVVDVPPDLLQTIW